MAGFILTYPQKVCLWNVIQRIVRRRNVMYYLRNVVVQTAILKPFTFIAKKEQTSV